MKNLIHIRLLVLLLISLFIIISCTPNLLHTRQDATKLINKKQYKKAQEKIEYALLNTNKPKPMPYTEDTTLYFYNDFNANFISKSMNTMTTIYTDKVDSRLSYIDTYSYTSRNFSIEDSINSIITFYKIRNSEDTANKKSVWEKELKKVFTWKHLKGVEPNYPYLYYLLSNIAFEEHNLTKSNLYLDTTLYYFPDFSEAIAKKMLNMIIQNKLDDAYKYGNNTLSKQICKMYARGTSLIYQYLGYISTINNNTQTADKQYSYAVIYNKNANEPGTIKQYIDSLRAINDWK
jgi:hypothetical protein